MLRIRRTPNPKRWLLGPRVFAAVAASILVTAGAAHADGIGVFTGEERAAESIITNMTNLCALFDQEGLYGPTVHDLDFTGTFDDAGPVSGTARFVAGEDYYASPLGTFSDEDCTQASSVSGTMTVTVGAFECEGDAEFNRTATSVYTLQYTSGGCDGVQVEFTGVMEPCSPFGCNPLDPNTPTALMEGVYEQS